MIESLVPVLRLLIPVLGVLIGLVVVSSVLFVQPLVGAITRLADVQGERRPGESDPAVRELEQRVASIESVLQRVLEDREFERQLQGSASPVGMRTAERAPVRD